MNFSDCFIERPILSGVLSIVILQLGTDHDNAQVRVQNRASQTLPKLPEEVRRIGVTTQKTSPDLLMVVHLFPPDNRYDICVRNHATHLFGSRAGAHERARGAARRAGDLARTRFAAGCVNHHEAIDAHRTPLATDRPETQPGARRVLTSASSVEAPVFPRHPAGHVLPMR